MKSVFLALALLSAPAWADDMVSRHGNDMVRLQEGACPPEVMELIPASIRDQFRAAVAIVDGKTYPGCWALYQGSHVFLQYLDGDQGLVSKSEFKRSEGL